MTISDMRIDLMENYGYSFEQLMYLSPDNIRALWNEVTALKASIKN